MLSQLAKPTVHMQNINQYTHFAEAYNMTNEPAFSREMSHYVLGILRDKLRANIGSVLDLSCGVGVACVEFAKDGLRSVGVDLSQNMIDLAKARARSEGCEVAFSVQDMRELASDEGVDLVTSMYDSLNFMLTEVDLERVFGKVNNILIDKGYFVFDIYTIKGLSELWGSQVEVHTDTDDHFIVSRTTWNEDSRTCSKRMDGFTRSENGFYRWSEIHISRAFEVAKVFELLERVGFEVVLTADWESESKSAINPNTRRAVIFARKV